MNVATEKLQTNNTSEACPLRLSSWGLQRLRSVNSANMMLFSFCRIMEASIEAIVVCLEL